MDKTEIPGVIRGTINGKAKYCRIPIRSRLFDAMQDGGELNADAILSMPHDKAVQVIDAIMADWLYWMRRAGEYFVALKAQEALQAPADKETEK